jgi:hypothetical protein
MNKNLARRTLLATTQAFLKAILAACAAVTQVSAPSNDQARQAAPPTTADAIAVPPGHRLEKFKLCYEMRRPLASLAETPVKHFSIDVSILVPQDDCLRLDANGWLRAMPGQCNRVAAKNSCEETP